MAKTSSRVKLENAISAESFLNWLAGISRQASAERISIKLPNCWESIDRTLFGKAQVTVHSSTSVAVIFEHSLGKFEWEFAVLCD